jgi:RHS repeat-associated protein
MRQLADASGNIVQSYTYAPFGELLAAQGTRSSALQYTGEQKDVDTGLVYLRARWYDSATGRFTTRDPFPGFAALPQTLHPYVYVNNNPVNLTDPSGKFAFLPLLFVAILGGMIGGASYYTLQAVLNADPCLGLQWHWQEALFWGGAGGVIGGLLGTAAYGGWQLGAKAIAWIKAIFLGGGGAAGATIIRTLQESDLSAIANFIRNAIDMNAERGGSFGETWLQMAKSMLQVGEQGRMFIARVGDQITGMMQVAYNTGAYTIKMLEGIKAGGGTALFKQAIQDSIARGFDGAISLVPASQDAINFYQRFAGYQILADGRTWYWSAEAARAILASGQ